MNPYELIEFVGKLVIFLSIIVPVLFIINDVAHYIDDRISVR